MEGKDNLLAGWKVSLLEIHHKSLLDIPTFDRHVVGFQPTLEGYEVKRSVVEYGYRLPPPSAMSLSAEIVFY